MKIVRNLVAAVLMVATALLLVVAIAGTWATMSVHNTERTNAAARSALSTPHGQKQLARLIADNATGPKDSYYEEAIVAAADPAVLADAEGVLADHIVADKPEPLNSRLITTALGKDDVTVGQISFERPDGIIGAISDNAGFATTLAPLLALATLVLSVFAAKRRSAQLRRICWVLRTMAVVSFGVSLLGFALPDEAATLSMTVVLQSISASAPQTTALALALALTSGIVQVVGVIVGKAERSLAGRSDRRLAGWDEYLTIDPHAAGRPVDHWTAPAEPEPFTIRKRPLPPLSNTPPWPPVDDNFD